MVSWLPATPFGRLSRGQKTQVQLALALGHSPELLVLDDPTLGLDPVARRALYGEIVGELADRGTTIFLTTHDLAGFEGIATRVGILKDGGLLMIPQTRNGFPWDPYVGWIVTGAVFGALTLWMAGARLS